MTCYYCSNGFWRGDHAVQVFSYWTTRGEDGIHDMYQDGMKSVGWAHSYCFIGD